MQLADGALFGLFTSALGLWWVIIPGMLLGIVVGILPGFSAQNTLIILLPLTLHMSIEAGMAFMISLYCTTQLGGGIPAILFNMPGEGGAAATTLDGYPMTRKGQAQQALVLCFAASAFGGLITTVATMAVLPALGQLGLYFRSVEMVVVMVFGLTLIAAIAAKDLVKGLIAGFFGLMIGAIGADPIYGSPRATFGFLELNDGVPLIPVLIGLFAISEALVLIESETIVRDEDLSAAKEVRWHDTLDGLWITARYWWQTVWTSLIGLVIGILPGAGSTVAAFLAYHYSKLLSKTPELYGTGHPPGVIAPESANNGVTSGTLVPVLALGIPGGTTGAIMMIVLTYHGVLLGPRLFIERSELVYSIYMQMLVSLPVHGHPDPAVGALHEPGGMGADPLPRAAHPVAGDGRRLLGAGIRLRHGPGAVLRRDRLRRPQDRIRGHGHPDRRAHGTAVRAVPAALHAHRPRRLQHPVLVDPRQRPVGDGGDRLGAALAPQPPARRRAGPHRRGRLRVSAGEGRSRLDHDAFWLNQPKDMNVIDSKKLSMMFFRKVVSTFRHHAPAP